MSEAAEEGDQGRLQGAPLPGSGQHYEGQVVVRPHKGMNEAQQRRRPGYDGDFTGHRVPLAFVSFGLAWMGTIVVAILVIGTLGTLLGNPALSGILLFPALMLLASMFFTSLYFTYRDSFELEPPTED